MNLPTAARPVPSSATKRLMEKFEEFERRRRESRFWQAVQASKQPTLRRVK